MCAAASRCSLVQRRAVNQNGGSPSTRSHPPSAPRSRAQRTSARAPFSCGRTYGVCIWSTDMAYRPRREAAPVSGYASPGPPPYHSARPSSPLTPSRTPSRGSGKSQSPSGITLTVRRSREAAADQW